MKNSMSLKTWRNLLIAFGFYGAYYAFFQFIVLIWRNIFVFDHTFSNLSGKFYMWLLYGIPVWIFLVISGFIVPILIESSRRYSWSFIVGSIFVISSILFSRAYYAEEPSIFENLARYSNIFFPLVFCPLGTLIFEKWKKQKSEHCSPEGQQGPGHYSE